MSVVLFAFACGERGTPQTGDSAVASTKTASPPAAPNAGSRAAVPDTGCPKWGLWQSCNVRDRLERAGLVLVPETTTVSYDFMGVPGTVYRTDRAEIQVFLYPSADARAAVITQLDTINVTPRSKRKVWRVPATMVTSNNLAAIILTLNERTAERVGLALGAGLPSAPPTRRAPR